MRRVFLGGFIVPLSVLAIASLIGCGDDKRVTEVAERAAERQAEQNSEMAQLNREVAEGTRRLVEADADSRDDFAALHQGLQSQQAEVNRQRDELECERRSIAHQRLRESLLAPVIDNLGLLLVVVAVLLFCGLLVSGLGSDEGEADAVAEILIEEIVAEKPNLLPPRASRHGVDGATPPPPVIADRSGMDAEDAGG